MILPGGNLTSCAMAAIRASCSGREIAHQLDAFQRNDLFDDVQFRHFDVSPVFAGTCLPRALSGTRLSRDLRNVLMRQARPVPLRRSARLQNFFLRVLAACESRARLRSRNSPAAAMAQATSHGSCERIRSRIASSALRTSTPNSSRPRSSTCSGASSSGSRNALQVALQKVVQKLECGGRLFVVPLRTRPGTPSTSPSADTSGRAAGTVARACSLRRSSMVRASSRAAERSPSFRSRKGSSAALSS